MSEPQRHDPMLLSAGGHGCWATCSCGWKSSTWTTVTAAHAAFGRHLASVPDVPTPTQGEQP